MFSNHSTSSIGPHPVTPPLYNLVYFLTQSTVTGLIEEGDVFFLQESKNLESLQHQIIRSMQRQY